MLRVHLIENELGFREKLNVVVAVPKISGNAFLPLKLADKTIIL